MKGIKIVFLSSIFFYASLHSMDLIFEFPDFEQDSSSIIVGQEEPEKFNESQNPILPLTVNLREIVPEPFDSKEIIYPQEINNSPGNFQTQSKKIEIPHRCKICNKLIKGNPIHMKYHLFTHTNEKPYQCSEGDYQGKQLTGCRRHILGMHLPESKAFIKELVKQFSETSDMQEINDNEFIKHSVIFPAVMHCSCCNKQFYEKHTYKRHQENCKPKPESSCKVKYEPESNDAFVIKNVKIKLHPPKQCIHCYRTFSNKSNYIKHQMLCKATSHWKFDK